jgi:hypothetical protein
LRAMEETSTRAVVWSGDGASAVAAPFPSIRRGRLRALLGSSTKPASEMRSFVQCSAFPKGGLNPHDPLKSADFKSVRGCFA